MITNFGSLCIDNVYRVPYFARPGETLPCDDYHVYPGGKGLNQSLALASGGASVQHAGRVGPDGTWLSDLLSAAGVNTDLIEVTKALSGHANIQVTPDGQNSIVLFGGANRSIDLTDVRRTMAATQAGEFLLLQNEISCLPEIMMAAGEKSLRTVFNAAPMTSEVTRYPLETVELFIVNELEGAAITGKDTADDILDAMTALFPTAGVLLTLGEDGAIYQDQHEQVRADPVNVEVSDTTGAGDTFTGFFLAGYERGDAIPRCLELACAAAALCVTRPGAASSIPSMKEVQSLLER